VYYREALPADAEEIAILQLELERQASGRSFGIETCRRGVRAVLENSSKGRYYVATSGRQIAVCLLAVPEWCDWRNGTVWRIPGASVLPAHHGEKLLPGLIDFVKALAMVEPGVHGIRLSVGAKDYPAKNAYARLGFVSVDRDALEWLKTG
jgi:hypothetical protein